MNHKSKSVADSGFKKKNQKQGIFFLSLRNGCHVGGFLV